MINNQKKFVSELFIFDRSTGLAHEFYVIKIVIKIMEIGQTARSNNHETNETRFCVLTISNNFDFFYLKEFEFGNNF
ncbi:hypothetical protein BpHYR1_027543 [Brachionus plicatilis]|uniref:Uncharacterized protein n=1 Tax=Brachionus plicatilis TaxID=10195 RepID=A0A3M7SP46_BRAPC|nr:hypothetical protein BpHYR1_027543 [Brachionus plicatilis]